MNRRRRRLAATVAAAIADPLLCFAQPQAAKVHRIGFIGTAFASGYVRELDAIREGLRDLGYVEGRNLAIEYRWAEGSAERLEKMAAELVALKVDLLLTHNNTGAAAAMRATKAIPIVMADGADPVATGLVASFARPGGNLTGSSSFVAEEITKRLQLLKELLPNLRRIGYLASSAAHRQSFEITKKSLLEAAAAMKVEISEYMIADAAGLPGAFNAMTAARIEAALIHNEPLLTSNLGAISSLAAVKQLPAAGMVSFADAGGLLAYGANRAAVYRRSAYFVDRIFKGTRPGEIPFERASKFDLIVNLKTAKALGIRVPESVLLRADRVIE